MLRSRSVISQLRLRALASAPGVKFTFKTFEEGVLLQPDCHTEQYLGGRAGVLAVEFPLGSSRADERPCRPQNISYSHTHPTQTIQIDNLLINNVNFKTGKRKGSYLVTNHHEQTHRTKQVNFFLRQTLHLDVS